MATKTNQQIAIEVIAGKWGNGADRRARLEAAGYNYDAIQSIVNALMQGESMSESHEIKFTGTKTLEIDIDITEYNSIAITFTDEPKPAPEPVSTNNEANVILGGGS